MRALAAEVKPLGWIAYAARSEHKDWDIFVCRPDGSDVRNITRTRDHHETWPQFSRDGQHLLFRRLPADETVDGNRYGQQGQPILALADGSQSRSLGAAGELPWACFSPDGKQVATLSLKGISIVDIASLKVVRTIPRKGFFQQLSWSPDGNQWGGVSNGLGTGWSVARMEVASGNVTAVSTVDCCTPDWFPDNQQMIFSNRQPQVRGEHDYGWTQLWRCDIAGREPQLIYAEQGRHIYGGCVSPDGKYILFTGNDKEDGDPQNEGSVMQVIRLADTPMVGGGDAALLARHPGAKRGPMLDLPRGFEPCWTARDIFEDPQTSRKP